MCCSLIFTCTSSLQDSSNAEEYDNRMQPAVAKWRKRVADFCTKFGISEYSRLNAWTQTKGGIKATDLRARSQLNCVWAQKLQNCKTNSDIVLAAKDLYHGVSQNIGLCQQGSLGTLCSGPRESEIH